ncbi:CHAT domain-containing protein [Amycolatopsis sp. RTGN1]|uniref:CHAT domain-containing protein n=1 Tax=Amycolatopsis ponsaeliensis TaxID=2992142 RepID=UPI00254DFBB4|nr:CHAT domain-containing protein [Amycolatopsis sp. RTGN1]
MTADEAERRITELSGRLGELDDGSDEQRATRAELAAALAVRYVQHGGSDADRVRATELADLVQADPACTAEQRDRMSQLALMLTMVGRTPAEALRDHPVPDLGAVLRATEWIGRTGEAGLLAGVAEMRARVSAATGLDSLPPGIRALFDLMSPLADLMESGAAHPSESTVAALNEVLDDAPQTGNPGIELLRLMMPMITPAAKPAVQADRLRQQLAGLPEDHMLTPMLRADLATLLVGGAGEGGPDDLREAEELLKRASSVPEAHPLSDIIRRRLAGALLASAAVEATPDRIAQAQDVVDQVLARTGEAGPARQGADLLLRSMLAILRGTQGNPGQTAAGVTDLLEVVRTLPADDDLHAVAVGLVGGVLADRHLVKGLLEDADSAALLLDKAAAAAGDDPAGGSAVIATLAASIDVSRALRTADDVGLAVAAERLDEAVARLPAAHVVRPSAELMAGLAGLRLALTGATNVRESVGDLHARLTGGPVPGHSADMLAVMADTASALAGVLDGESEEVLAGIERLEARLDRVTLPQHRTTVRALLGLAYLTAHERGIGPADAASRAVAHLEQARQSADGVEVIEVLRALARAYWAAGQRELACRHGFAALEEQAGLVLLQTGIGHAVLTARGAAADAAALAGWCLAAEDADAALRAIELGRGLALHAATSTLEVPKTLRDLGHPDLADAWADHTRQGAVPEPVTSGELRHRVLEVLRDSPAGTRLFVAPSMTEVAGELAGNDIDALVYVVPGTEGTPGRLIGVDRDGRPISRELPDLIVRSDGPLAEFIAADQNDVAAWKTALAALCDWAGTAVLGTVLESVGRGRRVVLVPLGELGVVSWPAARLGGSRFGCTELVLSTAASARQFLDSVRRPAQPIGRAPVLVTDPRGSLGFAAEEALVLHDVFYPGAVLLGDLRGFESDDDGAPLPEALPATPAAFLAHVPGADTAGASLLHLSCHAEVGTAAEASRLVLTEALPIDTVLRHAARREPGSPGGTVILTSCSSDLTAVDYDEALTLATAFLAAGAVTVIGSRWETGDRGTAVLMFATHHFLVRKRLPPAEALRAAQLWMLDPAREPLADLPEAMIGDLALPETTDVTIWGAFTHHGR